MTLPESVHHSSRKDMTRNILAGPAHALLIPATSERIEKANLMKRCMEAEGFEMKVFVSFEHAIEWFSEVVPLDPSH